MLPNPLHPAIVHFPVVLAFLLPLFSAGALWAIARGARSRPTWSVPLALAVALALSTWIAVETGEHQTERVERVVSEQPLDRHEEMAETFMVGAFTMVAIAGLGLLRGRAGTVARVTATVGAVALVAGASLVGHSGGELVYRYGAASAYARSDTNGVISSTQSNAHRGDDDGEGR